MTLINHNMIRSPWNWVKLPLMVGFALIAAHQVRILFDRGETIVSREEGEEEEV